MIEQNKGIITLQALATSAIPSLPNINWGWIASHLWTFLRKLMANAQLRRRLSLAQGEEFNGVELWRSQFVEYVGGFD